MKSLKFAAAIAFVVMLFGSSLMARAADPENTLILTLKDGDVTITLLPDLAPKHVEQIKKLVRAGEYDNVAFHRVIDGFMAQTGDVKYGDMKDGLVELPNCTSPVCAMKPSMTRWKTTPS